MEVCVQGLQLGTKPAVHWGHRLPSLEQKHPDQQGSFWAVGKCAVMHSS